MKIRQLIFSLLMLCATVAKAQFHSVDWSAVRGDSLLPQCTHVMDLPADYNSANTSRVSVIPFSMSNPLQERIA